MQTVYFICAAIAVFLGLNIYVLTMDFFKIMFLPKTIVQIMIKGVEKTIKDLRRFGLATKELTKTLKELDDQFERLKNK